MPAKASILNLPDHNFIAYHKTQGKKNKPSIVFLGGFMSDMQGTKALALEEFCKKNDYSFVRFDYFGHGESSGEFKKGTIGKWKENVLSVIDELTKGKLILVGSSLGGWLMLLATLERSERVAGLIGIASAPDFTEKLIFDEMTDEQKKQMQDNGEFILESEYGDDPYPISCELIEEARNHLLLDSKIEINCPIRLFHGILDADVPPDFSVQIGDLITSDNMCVNLIAGGDHRMSEPDNIEQYCEMIDELAKDIKESS
jgi:esterase/lipase